jgi:predicted dehydrogenase
VIYERPKTADRDMLTSEIESFLQTVRTRTRPRVSGEDGRRALEVALEIRDKAEEHKKRSAGP